MNIYCDRNHYFVSFTVCEVKCKNRNRCRKYLDKKVELRGTVSTIQETNTRGNQNVFEGWDTAKERRLRNGREKIKK